MITLMCNFDNIKRKIVELLALLLQNADYLLPQNSEQMNNVFHRKPNESSIPLSRSNDSAHRNEFEESLQLILDKLTVENWSGGN